VADYHTYFVGVNGAWVHNQCGPKFKTSKDAVKHAETMGYKEVKGVVNKAKQKVLHNKKKNPKYISRMLWGKRVVLIKALVHLKI